MKNKKNIYDEKTGIYLTEPSLAQRFYNFLYTIDDQVENVNLEITNGRIEFSADIKRGDNGQ